jgi:hypothetical protein
MAITNPSALGVKDTLMQVCNAQAIPTDGNNDKSANSFNTGIDVPDIGKGAKIDVVVEITTLFAKSANTPKLSIILISDSDAALGSPTDHGEVIENLTVAQSTVGAVFKGTIPSNPAVAYQKYLGVELEPTTNELTAGAINVYFDVGH